MSKQSFLYGTLILICAGMITRFLGFINRLVVARLMGEEGVGLYMMALPTLFLIITLTQLGLPIAISKRVAEAEARNDQSKVKSILTVSLVITSLTSIVFTISMILIAPTIANHFLTDARTLFPLIAVSPIVPIVAISAVLRGYFQGKQNMKPQSIGQVIEQIVRITCVALFIKWLLPYGIEFAAAGAMISVIIGELASLLFMVYIFKKHKTVKVRRRFFTQLKTSKQTLKELFSIALPSTASKLIGSVSQFLEPILVTQSLAIAGISSVIATKQYGELMGYALPLLFLPTFITHSLSVALIPSISQAQAQAQTKLTHYRIHQAIRLSFSAGAIATVILSLFSVPILTYMYGSANASKYIVFMAPFFILLYIQGPLQATLQALDLARPAMWNSLIGAIFKLTILFLLASNPNFGMMGVAIAMCFGVILVTLLHLGTLKKMVNFSLPFRDIFKMGLRISITAIVGYYLKQLFLKTGGHFVAFCFTIAALVLCYVVCLFLLKFITRDEFKQIPIIRNWI